MNLHQNAKRYEARRPLGRAPWARSFLRAKRATRMYERSEPFFFRCILSTFSFIRSFSPYYAVISIISIFLDKVFKIDSQDFKICKKIINKTNKIKKVLEYLVNNSNGTYSII